MPALNKVQDFLQDKITPIAGKIGEQRHINAMKNGLMATMPITILGGIATIIATPPVDPKIVKPTNFFNQFLLNWKAWSVSNAYVLNTPYNMTMGLLGLFTVIAVAYFLLKHYKMNIAGGLLTSVVTFLIVAAPAVAPDKTKPGALFLSTNYLDAKGMFLGIMLAFLTVEITKLLLDKNIKIKLPDAVPPMVSAPFEALIPLIVNVVLFDVLNNLLIGSTGTNMPGWVLKAFSPLVSASDSLPALIILLIVLNGLWFFGIHGGNIVNAVVIPFATVNLAENAAAVAQGLPQPHILSGFFLQTFGNIGGSGAAFGMVIAMLIVAKSAHLRSVSRLAIVPDIFTISEPLVFSTPTILNPFILIPWIIVPILNITVFYFATKLNLIGHVYINAPWTTPLILNSFLATMDWKAPVLFVIMIIVDVIIYIPFVKAYDNSLVAEEKQDAEIASATVED